MNSVSFNPLFTGAHMARFPQQFQETGHLFEERVLGMCLVKGTKFVPWNDAMMLVRKSQPKQKSRILRQVEVEVRKLAGVQVELFTAVGSALDFFHVIDCFAVSGNAVVTMDLTKNPNKDSGKAHLVIGEDEVENISGLAGRISRELKSQLLRKAA